ENGEFSASLSDILVTWKYLLKDKLNLHHEGAQASENYDLVRKHYDSFLKRSNMVDLTDIHGLYNQLKMESEPVAPVTAMQLFEFLSENSECSGEKDASKFVPACPSTPSNRPSQSHSQLLKAVKRLLCAYLNLLVNSKNDLALAHVLNIPDRGLGRVAFTDLKHAARNKQTSLFLAATSFVRAIQLGGKGYAPSETDPLRKHIKGLSDFVHFTDNLEELLGEIPDPSLAGGRMMTLIKMALLKGRSSGDPVCRAAEEALQELKQRISCINDTRKQATNPAGTGISPARPKAHTINHETAYGGREMVKVLLTLLDEEALCPPTRNKAKVLSAVEEGLELSAGACIVTLFRSPEQSNGSSPKPLRARIQERENQKPKVKGRAIRSQFAITYKDEDAILNRVLQFPSLSQVPTWVHPAPKPGHHPYSPCDDQSAAGTGNP
ncbi:PARI protein, partial [Amia calva]|nr:PARI protein [Amia calva]